MKLDSLITRIHMELSAGRVHEAYVPLVFNGMIGLFHNRFSKIWERASECLADLMKMHTGAVWNGFVRYLGQCQLKLEALHNHTESDNYSISQKYTGRSYNWLFAALYYSFHLSIFSSLKILMFVFFNLQQV